MAHRIGDRILDTTTSTGTGNITVSGTAQAGHKTLSDYCTVNGDTIDVVIAGGSQWEYVRLTRVSANEYSRAATPHSSSTGSAIDFSAGTKEVWGDIGAFFARHLNTIEIAVASASTCDIGAANGLRVEVTGTTTITSFGTVAHQVRIVRFAAALTLTHNGTSLILLTAANRTTAAGDIGIYASDGSGNWRELYFSRTPATASVAGILKRPTMAVIREEQTSGTAGGTFTQATDVTRVLNTKTDPDSIIVLASNQFQLSAGTWLVQWSAPGYRCAEHKSWLYNVTDNAVVAYGTSESAGASDVVSVRSTGTAIVTIAAAKAFTIRHRCVTTKADNGLGPAVSLGTEVYTEVVVRSYQQA